MSILSISFKIFSTFFKLWTGTVIFAAVAVKTLIVFNTSLARSTSNNRIFFGQVNDFNNG
ncbi:hypothetical protein [Liquorilactobacillus mali]|uniref:hypothetical protein n=1 Tax=Liquorilactobacillus mali TaxID=1618 RepID=UPI00234FF2B8|nr:hypothetical protein [Liquorilactobacillus mali]